MRGQWIALLDADDLWLPDKLQHCMDFLLQRPHLSIVYSPMCSARPDGSPMKGHTKPSHKGWITEKLFNSIFVQESHAVLHKRVIETCGGFDEILPVCVGHEFWLRVSTSFEFGLIDEQLALRRWREDSLTHSNRVRARATKATMLERFYFQGQGKYILSKNRALARLAKVNYSVGKIMLRQGSYGQAEKFLAKALRYHRGCLKAYPFFLTAKLMSILCGQRTTTV